MYSGVPKAGAPVFMSTLDVKPPYTTGAPGRTICVKAMPASASAFCCARAPAIVTGAIAPASVNGVSMMIWLRDDISMMPCSIGVSSRSGDELLMMENNEGSASICSREMPRAMRAISSPSWLRSLPSEYTWKGLSVSLAMSDRQSRCRTDACRSTGSTG